jgi:hypothetical protein
MLLEVSKSGLLGLARGRAIRAEYMAQRAEASVEAIIAEANAKIADAQAIITQTENQNAALEARIRELDDALAVQKAHAGGLEAQVKAFVAQHPDSPLRADSGLRFIKTGNTKSKARLIYEGAFDAILRGFGIQDPSGRRAN